MEIKQANKNVVEECTLMAAMELYVSWSPPIGPTAYWALRFVPWSGAPNPNMVGGPLSHNTIKRGGDQGSNYEVDWSRCEHPQRNLIRSKVSAASDGKLHRLRRRLCTDIAVTTGLGSPSPLDLVTTTLDSTAPSCHDAGIEATAAPWIEWWPRARYINSFPI